MDTCDTEKAGEGVTGDIYQFTYKLPWFIPDFTAYLVHSLGKKYDMVKTLVLNPKNFSVALID